MGWFPGWTPEVTCRRKRQYETWEDARRAGLLVTQENPRPGDVNGPLPYPCEVVLPRHYHYGHAGPTTTRRRNQ